MTAIPNDHNGDFVVSLSISCCIKLTKYHPDSVTLPTPIFRAGTTPFILTSDSHWAASINSIIILPHLLPCRNRRFQESSRQPFVQWHRQFRSDAPRKSFITKSTFPCFIHNWSKNRLRTRESRLFEENETITNFGYEFILKEIYDQDLNNFNCKVSILNLSFASSDCCTCSCVPGLNAQKKSSDV